MIKFFKYLFTIGIMIILINSFLFWGIVCQKKGVFHSSYQSLIIDKYRMLQQVDDKKIIIISGSSSAFGLDQTLLENETGYKVVNLGLHAGFGQIFYSELAKENINPGDIILLGYEYDWEQGFNWIDPSLVMSGIDDNIDMYKHIPIKHWPDIMGYLFDYAEKKNLYVDASGLYSREAFDTQNSQLIYTRNSPMSIYDKESLGSITVSDRNGNIEISERSIKYLMSLKSYIEKRGASVYFISPPVLEDSVICSSNDFAKFTQLEEEKIGIPYISNPVSYIFPTDLMYDSRYHCNDKGECFRTNLLIQDLKEANIVN